MTNEELNKILSNHKDWDLSHGEKGERADLSWTDLGGIDMSGASLREANLKRANLRGTNLSDADLSGANLYGADLSDADLSDANLKWADLSGVNLQCAKLPDYKIAPECGSFIAWKKLSDDYLAKIEIPPDAKRCSNLVSRKCRSDKIKILEIYDKSGELYTGSECIKCWADSYDQTYKTGETYTTELDDDIRIDCTKGFHFFITIKEAEEW